MVIFTNVLFYYYRFFIHGMMIQSVLFCYFLCWKESDRTENMINLYLVAIFKFTGAQSQENLSPCWLFSHFFLPFIQFIDFFHKGIEKKKKNWKRQDGGDSKPKKKFPEPVTQTSGRRWWRTQWGEEDRTCWYSWWVMIIKGQVGHEVSEERRARELWRIRNCPPRCHNLALPKCGWAGPATKKRNQVSSCYSCDSLLKTNVKHERRPSKWGYRTETDHSFSIFHSFNHYKG